MNWKKFLTENVLHEVWHESRLTEESRCSCERPYYLGTPYDHCNRRYDNELDMMELYGAIYMDGKWNKFFDWAYWVYRKTESGTHKKFVAWLFCLDGADYEDRCKMVAEFYRWE